MGRVEFSFFVILLIVGNKMLHISSQSLLGLSFSYCHYKVNVITRGVQPDRVYLVFGSDHLKNRARNWFSFKLIRESVPIFKNRLKPVRFPILGKDPPRIGL